MYIPHSILLDAWVAEVGRTYICLSLYSRASSQHWIEELAIADTNIAMAVITELVAAFAVMFPLLAQPALAGSLADIEHVILFMQGATLFSLL